MTDQEQLIDSVKAAIDEAFIERFSRIRADDPDYEERVAWVRSQIQREKDYHKMRLKIIESSCVWALFLALGFVGLAVWHEVALAVSGGK